MNIESMKVLLALSSGNFSTINNPIIQALRVSQFIDGDNKLTDKGFLFVDMLEGTPEPVAQTKTIWFDPRKHPIAVPAPWDTVKNNGDFIAHHGNGLPTHLSNKNVQTQRRDGTVITGMVVEAGKHFWEWGARNSDSPDDVIGYRILSETPATAPDTYEIKGREGIFTQHDGIKMPDELLNKNIEVHFNDNTFYQYRASENVRNFHMWEKGRGKTYVIGYRVLP